MPIIRVKLPASQASWLPDPVPGSEAARDRGCTCPSAPPPRGHLDFADDCSVHELEVAGQ